MKHKGCEPMPLVIGRDKWESYVFGETRLSLMMKQFVENIIPAKQQYYDIEWTRVLSVQPV